MVAIYQMCGLVPRPRKCKKNRIFKKKSDFQKKLDFQEMGVLKLEIRGELQPLRDKMGKKFVKIPVAKLLFPDFCSQQTAICQKSSCEAIVPF